LTNVWMKSPL
ncbi:rod shape-determining protein MreB and related proteins, partial [Candidatus Hakubella thermalkaliphila]